METTANLGLIKPGVNEVYDVQQFNYNMDKIDAAHPFKATTAGTASALTATGLPETDGKKAQLKLHIDIADGATLNGKPILTSAGEAIAAGATAGSYLELVYNASAASWYQIGGGSKCSVTSDIPIHLRITETGTLQIVYDDGE